MAITTDFKGNVYDFVNSSFAVLPSRRTWPTCSALSSIDALCSTAALALRLQAPFGPASTVMTSSEGDAGSSLYSNTCPPQKKARRKKPPVECSEQWQFLKMLPNQRVRDIAFVVTSPSTFSDSNELPLVSKDMFGEDESWPVVADWLKGLDVQEVSQWFEGRRYTTRLGDHFAACIEYVLKFSPLVQPEPLFISQQVLACTVPDQQSLRTLKVSKVSELGSFELDRGCVVSEVIVRLIENDVLVKRFSSYCYNGKGRVRNIPDSEIDSVMAEFKNSPFDYHGLPQLATEVPQEDTQTGSTGHMNVESVALHSFCAYHVARKQNKWRVYYTTLGKDQEVPDSGQVHASGLHGQGIAGNKPGPILMGGSETRSMLSPSKQEITSGSKGSMQTSPNGYMLNVHAPLSGALLEPLKFRNRRTKKKKSITRSVSAPNKLASASSGKASKKQTVISRSHTPEKAQLAERLKEMKSEKRNMAGECDFLFKANAAKLMRDPREYVWTEVHHWEVCVHFLSYIGPWEAFGLVTPGSAVWHQSGKRVFAATEGIDPDDIEIYLPLLHDLHSKEMGDNQYTVLDACYIAATIGDTWFDRKRSLASKLQLCRHPNMAAKLSCLFHSSLRSSSVKHSRSQDFRRDNPAHPTLTPEFEPLCGPHGEDYRDDPSIIRIIPRALTKGYLFYEPQLWLALSMRKPQCKRPNTHEADCEEKGKRFSTSSLSADHWIGWWVYARDFAEFAREYGREKSMWYVAPRHEWLSPIVIGSMERHRCSRVLDIIGFMAMLLKVGEEGAALSPPRQRRFLAVEVCWDADVMVTSLKVNKGYCDGDNIGGKGGWVEVSRGFVVETTWPQSRAERAHGFNLSWSPALLGWT